MKFEEVKISRDTLGQCCIIVNKGTLFTSKMKADYSKVHSSHLPTRSQGIKLQVLKIVNSLPMQSYIDFPPLLFLHSILQDTLLIKLPFHLSICLKICFNLFVYFSFSTQGRKSNVISNNMNL